MLARVLKEVTEVYACAALSDPPLDLKLAAVANELPFDPAMHQPFDGKLKKGTGCVVVFPALKTGDGQLLEKAQLAAAGADLEEDL